MSADKGDWPTLEKANCSKPPHLWRLQNAANLKQGHATQEDRLALETTTPARRHFLHVSYTALKNRSKHESQDPPRRPCQPQQQQNPGTFKLERHNQGDKHPSPLKEQTTNAAQGPLLGPTSPKLDLNKSAQSTLPRMPSIPTYPQHWDTVEHHTESENEKSDFNSDEDVNFNLDHNLGSFRHSGSLNSTIPQSEDIDRDNYILNVHNHVERPYPRSDTTNLDLLDIKTSTHDPNLFQPSPLARQRSHSSATRAQVHPG